ncbi:hypothetical protein [Aquimarina litoralis]|uniref:hypothetical protein n=1 Tax=Aquimarina litoralis TaxID=584605 RepID=UPI001C5702D1|nr:hypothetical protein [Aquimarina litoralis]MBW1295864.1 hypothetical protein [Aquimarina litoralis]
MLNTYYRNLTKKEKQFAIKRIASKTYFTEEIVEKVLKRYNPLMEIKDNRIAIHKNSYHKLVREIYKEYSMTA